ncbi:FixH family protein [Alkalicoccus daliensis]|uniref:YtkA-like n=1 Tax=Alkalicoccus daliensis TaxID=745820 RepID=A0A1H0FRL6_9BACI|nr:FixH family protein [Alkalicoccus daliensis]SDN97323.1 YtkA-like [Alkalicoccus daliensis]
MKKIMITAALGLLAACGTTEENNNEQSGAVGVDEINLAQLEAEIEAPDTLEPGEEAELRVLVTQGEEIVDDASEVTWEIWQAGAKEESDMLEADLPGEEGWYSVQYDFEEEAVYHVQSHTTARGMHVMPVHDIIVGDPEEEELESAEETEHENSMNDHEHGGNEENNHEHGEEGTHEQGENNASAANEDHSLTHGAMHESMSIDWNTPANLVGVEEVTITMDIFWEEEAWEDGEVRLEIWQHHDEMRTWLEAEETDPGTYEKTFAPEESGSYHIMVHLEDEEVHEHIQYELYVEE